MDKIMLKEVWYSELEFDPEGKDRIRVTLPGEMDWNDEEDQDQIGEVIGSDYFTLTERQCWPYEFCVWDSPDSNNSIGGLVIDMTPTPVFNSRRLEEDEYQEVLAFAHNPPEGLNG